MSNMRAKVRVGSVVQFTNINDEVSSENITFYGVSKPRYDDDGLDDDNTYAKFSPTLRIDITIQNPNLFGKYEIDQQYYIDFTPVV